jgi:signal transduction histidine kinase
MVSSADVEVELASLADYLTAERQEILASMRRAVSGDPRLAVALKLPRVQFQDHLPQLLSAFSARLRARTQREESSADSREVEGAEQHGRNRWQQGYNLGETILEWRHLHECLQVQIERFDARTPMSAPAMRSAIRALATLFAEGVSESAQQHAQLHQQESQARASELSQALEHARALETTTAHTWREALHDLRGSMGLVRNASAVLVHDTAPHNARVQSQQILSRGVAAVVELLEELTDLARLESGQERVNLSTFDAGELLSRLCATTRPLAATRGLFVHADGEPELMVSGDAAKVQRIAQNLLLNAVRYTERGGVWVRWAPLDGPANARRWKLTVQDSGPGMSIGALPAGDASTDRAASASSSERSEGLGLPIVRRLCLLLDAVIEVTSSPTLGTTFCVTFPSTSG